MEQYQFLKKQDFRNLRLCLDSYQAEHLFIRTVPRDSFAGTVVLDETLEKKTLDFRKDRAGLHLLVDAGEVFLFLLADYTDKNTKGFSLAYERIAIVDGQERQIMLGTGVDPYDPALPEPRRSTLRHVLDNHLVEISFKGRIDLEFHSWWKKPYWKYWTIARKVPSARKSKQT